MKTGLSLPGIVVGSLVGFAAFGHPSSLQVPAQSDQDTADRNSGMIRGRVFTAEGKSPLAKATVRLFSADGRGNERPRTVGTDSRGEYEFRNLEAGKYLLHATRNGYLRQVYGRKTSSRSGRRQRGTPLSLTSGQVLDSIDFKMIRGGVVEGTVVDQHNELRSRVLVTLSSYDSSGGERKLFTVGHAETDDRGRFRLFDIPPGSYYLSAAPPVLYGRMGGEERSFPPIYYPGVPSPLEAAKVTVAAGEEVGGFYFTLVETRSYSVSGRVLTAEGKPAHSVWILSSREADEASIAGMESSANTDLQGEFKVTGLLPGRHRLHARAGEAEKPRMASTAVEVADRDIEGLTLVLGAGAEVTGRVVTDRQDSDLDWRRIWLEMDPIGDRGRISFGGESGRVEEDFTFKIKNLPASSYRMVVRLPPGNHYVKSIRLQTEELIDRPIEVRSADRLDEVEIHVSSEGAQISGVVEQEEAREVAEGATVLAFAADSDFRGPNSRFTKTTQTDQRGRYALEGLAPGEYLLCAVADHESGLESDLDYLASLERDSQRIDLSSGQTIEESLVALPAPKRNGP